MKEIHILDMENKDQNQRILEKAEKDLEKLLEELQIKELNCVTINILEHPSLSHM